MNLPELVENAGLALGIIFSVILIVALILLASSWRHRR
jgi:tetrahydromethanopterin S-methyltransferase subunit F